MSSVIGLEGYNLIYIGDETYRIVNDDETPDMIWDDEEGAWRNEDSDLCGPCSQCGDMYNIDCGGYGTSEVGGFCTEQCLIDSGILEEWEEEDESYTLSEEWRPSNVSNI